MCARTPTHHSIHHRKAAQNDAPHTPDIMNKHLIVQWQNSFQEATNTINMDFPLKIQTGLAW